MLSKLAGVIIKMVLTINGSGCMHKRLKPNSPRLHTEINITNKKLTFTGIRDNVSADNVYVCICKRD